MPEQIPFAFDVPSVSEFTEKIKALLESKFTDALVEGELSNVNQSRNGHYYFTLKDKNAQLPCVMWRNTTERLGSKIIDGQQVVLGGSLQVYPPHGRYQLIVSLVQQAGIGKLQEAFEKLKQKLQEEGLFDDKNKKPLPDFPQKIGVITSSTGAAFQDIISTMERRWPLATVYLYHASVQGVNAAPELVNGIQYFSEGNEMDLLIIGRGGGSLEDLWPFNEESVARALFNCPIPVISAVGHEVDFSISDFVADMRAATPTQASVMAVPDINEIRFKVEDSGRNLAVFLENRIMRYREILQRLGGSHALLVVGDHIKHQKERIDNLQESINLRFEKLITSQKELIKDYRNTIRQKTERCILHQKESFTALSHRLEKCDPNEPLAKGYVRVLQNDSWVRQPEKFTTGHAFDLQWKDRKIRIHQNPE